jgi:hypothetical protein
MGNISWSDLIQSKIPLVGLLYLSKGSFLQEEIKI